MIARKQGNNSGFTAVEPILILAIFIMVGVVAYLVLRSDTQDLGDNHGSIDSSLDGADTIIFTDERTGVSFQYPETWGKLELESDTSFEDESLVRYYGQFSNNQHVKVVYNQPGYKFLGGGCELSYVHTIGAAPDLTDLEETQRIVDTANGKGVLSESEYYDSDCEKVSDYDSIAVATGSRTYPGLKIVYEYDTGRSLSEQGEFLDLINTIIAE